MQAWFTAVMSREKKIRSLNQYLAMVRPKKTQSGEEVLAVLQSMKASGAKMNIRKIKTE